VAFLRVDRVGMFGHGASQAFGKGQQCQMVDLPKPLCNSYATVVTETIMR
jgi:hypothetical protein